MRGRVLLTVMLALALSGHTAAHAHQPGIVAPDDRVKLTSAERVIDEIALSAGHTADIVTHADRVSALDTPQARLAYANYVFDVRAPFSTPRVDHLADQWCGTPRTTDNTANAVNRTSPQLKVIYAYPSDKPSRFDQNLANLIQRKVKDVSQMMADASGGQKTLRWDQGTDCGPQYLDIQVVRLPQPLSYYGRSGGTQAYYDIIDGVHGNPYTSPAVPAAAADLAKGGTPKRNYVIYADYTSEVVPYGGQGMLYSDESKNGAAHRLGELDAVLYYWGPYNSASQTFSDVPYHHEVLLHEISHNLGAVQNNAPHSSKAGHCYDEWDVMCYNDGGSGMPAGGVQFVCNDAQYGTRLVYDCGGDDYFNPAPAAGSYLATKWNVFNSVFLCPVSSCNNVNGAPSAALTASTFTPQISQTVEFDASYSTDDGGITSYDWDLDGDGVFETVHAAAKTTWSFSKAGTYTVSVRVRDDGDLTSTASVSVQVAQPNRPPTVRLTPSASTAAAGATVQFSAAGTYDPDAGDSVSLRWDLDGDGSFETSGGQVQTRTFTAAGGYTVSVRAVDSRGEATDKSVKVTIIEQRRQRDSSDDDDPTSRPDQQKDGSNEQEQEQNQSLSLSATPARQNTGTVVSRGVLADVRMTVPGKVTVRVAVDAKTAKRLRLRVKGADRVIIGRASVQVRDNAARMVRVRLSRSARSGLRRRSAVLTLLAEDSSGDLSARRSVRSVRSR